MLRLRLSMTFLIMLTFANYHCHDVNNIRQGVVTIIPLIIALKPDLA